MARTTRCRSPRSLRRRGGSGCAWDAAARIAGHAVVEAGTHVEILGEHRWWPGTITGREEGSDGRLVHAVEYDGYPDQDFRLNLEEVPWRRATPHQ